VLELYSVQYDWSHDSQPNNTLMIMKAIRTPIAELAVRPAPISIKRFT